jgi:hypothetical protein
MFGNETDWAGSHLDHSLCITPKKTVTKQRLDMRSTNCLQSEQSPGTVQSWAKRLTLELPLSWTLYLEFCVYTILMSVFTINILSGNQKMCPLPREEVWQTTVHVSNSVYCLLYKVLLEHSFVHLFIYIWSLIALCYNAESDSMTDCITNKA